MITGAIGFYLGGFLVVGTATASSGSSMASAFVSAAIWPVTLILKTIGFDQN